MLLDGGVIWAGDSMSKCNGALAELSIFWPGDKEVDECRTMLGEKLASMTTSDKLKYVVDVLGEILDGTPCTAAISDFNIAAANKEFDLLKTI